MRNHIDIHEPLFDSVQVSRVLRKKKKRKKKSPTFYFPSSPILQIPSFFPFPSLLLNFQFSIPSFPLKIINSRLRCPTVVARLRPIFSSLPRSLKHPFRVIGQPRSPSGSSPFSERCQLLHSISPFIMGDLHMNGVVFGEDRPCASSPPSPPLPASHPDPSSVTAAAWSVAEKTTRQILRRIQPTLGADRRRREVVDYVQRLIRYGARCEVIFVFFFNSIIIVFTIVLIFNLMLLRESQHLYKVFFVVVDMSCLCLFLMILLA